MVDAPGGRHIAAAVGDDDHRHAGERPDRARVAVEPRQVLRGLAEEAGEGAGLPELAGARIGRVERELRRDQGGVDAGGGDLRRHLLAQVDVVGQLGAVAVEEDDQEAGPADVEALGQVQEHLTVAVGLVLPVDAAGPGAVAAPAVLGDVEEGLVGARHQPRVGEGRGVELHELGACRAASGPLRVWTRWGTGTLGSGRRRVPSAQPAAPCAAASPPARAVTTAAQREAAPCFPLASAMPHRNGDPPTRSGDRPRSYPAKQLRRRRPK